MTERRIYITPGEAAELLGVKPRTVKTMIADGRLASNWEGAGGTERILLSDVKKLALSNPRKVHPTPEAGITHGLYGYTQYKCRCDICRNARSDYVKARRAAAQAALAGSDVEHGLRYTYTELGCRCEVCKAANAAYAAQRRAARKRLAAEIDFDNL